MQQYNELSEPFLNKRAYNFSISLKWLTFILFTIVISIGVLNYLSNPLMDPQNFDFLGGTFYKLFALDHEANVPTWCATIFLFICGQLCLVTGMLERRDNNKISYWWLLLGIAFIFLSADEAAGFHEPIAEYFRHHYPLFFSGFLRGGWTIPYLLILCAVLPFFIKHFLLKIPRRLAAIMVFSGVIFLTGAVAFEMIGGFLWDNLHGRKKEFWYQMAVFFEEILELSGTCLFVFALSKNIISKEAVFQLR